MPEVLKAGLGSGIPVRTPYVKTAAGLAGGDIVSATTATPETTMPVVTATPDTPPASPERPLSLIEQFHPSLDPAKVEMSWDEATGRLRVAPKEESAAVETTVDDETAPPTLGEQHASIPGGSETPSTVATPEASELRDQVGQLTQLVTLMAQAQISGKPLGELLGVGAPAVAPSEPDYSQIDLLDPSQLAGFIKQQVQDGIRAGLAPHQETIEQARRRQEYDRVAAANGGDTNFNNKVVAALQVVKQNPSLTIEQGYALVNQIAQTIAPTPAAAPLPPAPAKPATRTITREEAEAKAAQAAKLPGNSGVRGAGAAPMPSHIKGLGQMLAWNLQQASLGN